MNPAKRTGKSYHAAIEKSRKGHLKVTAEIWIEGDELESLELHPIALPVPRSIGVSVERNRAITQPLTLLDGLLLDGEARRIEAVRHGLRCPVVTLDTTHIHPVIFVAQANAPRLTNAERAVLAARFVAMIKRRHPWLAKHDRGMAARVKSRTGRKPLLAACLVTERSFLRASGARHDDLLDAIAAGHVSLDDAFAMRELSAPSRQRILALDRSEHKAAIADAVVRQHRVEDRRRQLPLLDFDTILDRGARVMDFNIAHELGHYTPNPVFKRDAIREYFQGSIVIRKARTEQEIDMHDETPRNEPGHDGE